MRSFQISPVLARILEPVDMRSAVGPALLMLGAFAALEISESTTGQNAASLAKSQASSAHPPIKPLTAPGIDNLYRLAPNLYSGSRPSDRASLDALARLGVKTIISVEGARPDAPAAQNLGIRTVHLPIGYHGIDTAQSARLVKAARTLPTPLYICCRHGQHRGPAAAALIAMATEGWNVKEGLDWLETAGTSKQYPGLYNALKVFQIPTNAELTVVPDDWPDSTDVSMTTQSMLEIDACWETLKAEPSAAGATELAGLYRRLIQAPALGEDLQKRLHQAIDNAEDLRTRLEHPRQPLANADREQLLERSARDCKTCHEAHRN